MNCHHLKSRFVFAALLAVTCPIAPLVAQDAGAPLDLKQSLSPRESEMRIVIQRYEADRDQLSRFYMVGGGGRGGGRGGGGGAAGLSAPSRFGRMKLFYNDWQSAAQKIDTSKLAREAATDKQKLLDEIKRDRDQLDNQYRAQAEVLPAVPFASIIFGLEDGRRKMEKPDAEKAALQVSSLTKQIAAARKDIETGKIPLDKATGRRGADAANTLRTALRSWNGFYNDYDPLFTWWMSQPYKEADKALGDYADFLRERSSGDDTSPAAPKDSTLVSIVADKPGKVSDVPDLNELLNYPQSEMRGVITRFNNEVGGGRGGGGGRRGAGRGGASRQLAENWLAALAKLDFDSMSRPAQVDYLLLRNRLEGMRDRSGSTRGGGGAQDDAAKFLPFDTALTDLTSPTRPVDKPDSSAALTALKNFKQQVEDAQKSAGEELKGDNATAARRGATAAARNIPRLQGALKEWFDRNESADSKWAAATSDAYAALDQALGAYAEILRGPSTASTPPRDTSDFAVLPPVGHDELVAQLKSEMIIYTPEELIARAQKEFAWCESEMKKASRQMGFGDDWKKALEKVKNDHVKEGEQPYLIAFLMREAVDYISDHKMITIPIVASETLQMEMMSPQRQLVNPFFTGGALISVSYPTESMTTDAKEQSMRGNNIDFARATVFHEMIPGHNFQGYNSSRYYGYRRGFGTPFWGEGWACYWELLLYQQGFPKSPENKIGMLFWRMHRCARIEFSLKYQLGQWTPKQCIDFLVDRVGHERENATAEVRRSFEGGYAPLYQCAYLLGAMQLLELHKELVESGKMSERAFHDAIIQGGSMPIAMVRAGLTKEKLTADYKVNWRF